MDRLKLLNEKKNTAQASFNTAMVTKSNDHAQYNTLRNRTMKNTFRKFEETTKQQHTG